VSAQGASSRFTWIIDLSHRQHPVQVLVVWIQSLLALPVQAPRHLKGGMWSGGTMIMHVTRVIITRISIAAAVLAAAVAAAAAVVIQL